MNLRSRHCAAPASLLALFLAASGCVGDERPAASPTVSGPATETPPPSTLPVPEFVVRVLDGDSGKPVRRARVSIESDQSLTGRDGVASLPRPASRRFRVVAAARGYATRAIRIGRDRPAVVRIWRPATQWPMYGGDNARSQARPAIHLRPPFRLLWKRRLGLVEFPAVIWGGRAYVANESGMMHALSVRTGRVLWKRRIGSRMASSSAIDPERGLLVATTIWPGEVKALSLATGHVRWRVTTGGVEASPVIRDGIAYVTTTTGSVYALDLDKRRVRWTFHGGVKMTASPTLVGGRLIFGDYAGRVFALRASNGRVLWQASAGTRVYGTAAVADGRVYVPSISSGLVALSARSGRFLWSVPVGSWVYSSPAAYRGRVYFGSYGDQVYCVDARTGRVQWRRDAGGNVSGAVVVVGGVVYAGSMGKRITAWTWRGGRELWSFPEGRYVPVSANGSVLLLHGAKAIWGAVPRKHK